MGRRVRHSRWPLATVIAGVFVMAIVFRFTPRQAN
jgi:hypothetical protein